jgi:hypothetical protein
MVLAVLEFELRALCLLGRSFFALVIFWTGSWGFYQGLTADYDPSTYASQCLGLWSSHYHAQLVR